MNIEDDEDAFWCLEELLNGEHSWRDIFSDDTPKLCSLLREIEERLKKKCPKVLTHLNETTQLNVEAAFSSIFITLFIYDLNQAQATRIFEMFLLDGESLLVKFLVRMIRYKEKRILQMYEGELLKYLRQGMIQECLQEYPLERLLR